MSAPTLRRRRRRRHSSRCCSGSSTTQPLVYLDSANTSQKPQRGHRRDERVHGALVRADQPQRISARRPRPPTRSRAPAPRCATFINARRDHEVVFTKNATESLNLVAYCVGPGQPRGGRRRRAHRRWSTTPTSCRGTCSCRRRASSCGGCRSPPTASSTSPTLPQLLDGAKAFCVHGDEQRARHHHPGAAAVPRRARRRARSPSSTAASTCRTTSPTCRRGAPTSSRSAATSCAARRASACCGVARNCSTRCRRSSAAAT